MNWALMLMHLVVLACTGHTAANFTLLLLVHPSFHHLLLQLIIRS